MKLQLLLFFCILASFSCSKDEGDSMNKTDINLVTGLYLKENPYVQPITLGNPNVYDTEFSVYPNPPAGIIEVSASEQISAIWIRPATAKKIYQETNFGDILDSSTYTESQITTNFEMEMLGVNQKNVRINLENLNSGYYRVFVKISGNVYWDNIYVPDENFTFEDFEDLIDYWN